MTHERIRTALTPGQAASAIYVDFECLMGRPPERPQPKLLGVLIGTEDREVDQLILDDHLAPAAAASRRTRVVSVEEAVGNVVAAANANDQIIVGWSFFDRDRMVDARPDLAFEIDARYVNAIQLARPWRQKIHPAFRIEREDAFAPTHTLDKYARLAGYPGAKALVGAEPATWIRDVLKELSSITRRARVRRASGPYRSPALSERSESKWHRVLEYNRHDLLALRHIVLRASRELTAWRAYEKTRFCVDEGTRRVCFMAGSRSGRLDRLLERHGAQRWAFITAWNPYSQRLDPRDNQVRQQALKRAVERYRTLPGEGIGEDPNWQPEESLLVLNISERTAVKLARRFGQLAIVVGRRGAPSRLVSCVAPRGATTGAARRD